MWTCRSPWWRPLLLWLLRPWDLPEAGRGWRLLRTSLSARWPWRVTWLTAPMGAHAEPVAFGLPFPPELSVLWFVLWRSSEAIYLLEHTVRILSHRVGHGAGKPVECGFRLPCIQERSDSRTFPWHVGWVCCSYSWNPLVAFSEIQSDKNDWTNQQTGCSSEHLSEPYHAVRRSTCSLCQPGGHTVWPFPVSMLEHKGLKKTDRQTDRRSQPSKAEMSTVCSQ